MKAIYMVVLGFAFVGNAMAACPQEMGYLAPEDMLPTCDSTAQSQPAPHSMQMALVEQATSAKAEGMCPQDIGYLAPTEMLPPCSRGNEKNAVSSPALGVGNGGHMASPTNKKSDAQARLANLTINQKEGP
jgi:hypothetical protein